jgi:hypothetical protein
MGYDLHITRAEDWGESEKTPITMEEWKAVIAADPELELDPNNDRRLDRFSANWVDPVSREERGWFAWSDGEISTKNPDRAQLGKMLQIAERLGAQVQGDDREKYTTPEAISEDPYKEVAAHGRSLWWFTFGLTMLFLCLSTVSWLLGRFSLILWIGTGLFFVASYFLWKETQFRS